MQRMETQNQTLNWEAHVDYVLHPNSELNVLMKCYSTKLENL